TTRADEVKVAGTAAEVDALLGKTDAPAKAWMRVFVGGYDLACGDKSGGAVRAAGDGYEVIATRMTSDCAPITTTRYLLKVGPDTATHEEANEVASTSSACIGRRPEALASAPAASHDRALGRYFAESAYLEAASVDAFLTLRDELAAHGAPAELQREAV